MFSDQAAHEQEVAPSILLFGEQDVGHGTGSIVHCQQQRRPGTFLPEPVVMAAVDLQEHPLLVHAPAAHPVLLRAAARAADASPEQDAAHGGTAQINTFLFSQQFGEVSMVCSRVVSAGQWHHFCRLGLRDSVVGPSAPVAMGQRGGSVLLVGIQEPPSMALTHTESLGGLDDRGLVSQDVIEHVESR